MTAIYKYPLEPGENTIEFPNFGVLAFAGKDGTGRSSVWAQVDPEQRTSPRKVKVVATGQEYDSNKWTYAFTWIDGPFVWHLLVEKDFYLVSVPVGD